MPLIIHIVCQGEAQNIVAGGGQLRDPSLTKNGFKQSQNLRDTFPYMDQVGAIFSSPLRRVIQTAQTAFEPLAQRHIRITLLPSLQELGGDPSNTGSPWRELLEEFGYKSLNLQHLYDGWWYKGVNTTHDSNPDRLSEQARQTRMHIRQIARGLGEKDHIVIVTHRLLVRYLVDIALGFEDDSADAEFRSYYFVDLDGNDRMAYLGKYDL